MELIMAWLKMTSSALYLMAPGTDRYLEKRPVTLNSSAHPKELGTEIPTKWFVKELPTRLIVDLTASEPQKLSPESGL